MAHIEDLLKRPRIEKPIEEFILPSDPEVPPLPPDNVSLLPGVSTIAASSAVQTLVDEADQIQSLIDMVISTAEEIEVSVPETESDITGATITTHQYLDALQADPMDPNASRVKKAFEEGLISSSSDQWPLLALEDMFDLRDTLRSTADVIAGNALASTPITSGQDWAQSAVSSHMAKLQKSLIQNSIRYRAKFLHSVLTLNVDLQGQFLDILLTPMLSSIEREVRQKLIELRDLLTTIRQVLSLNTYFRSVEFSQIRDVVENKIISHLTRSLLQTLVVLLSRATNKVAQPVIQLLEEGFGGGSPLAQATDYVSQQVAGVLVDAVGAIVSYYGDIAADLIRQQDKKVRVSVNKLQVLGEHSVTNRWMVHIDEALTLINGTLHQTTLTREAANVLANSIREGIGLSQSKLVKKVQEIPGIESIQDVPFSFRSSVIG